MRRSDGGAIGRTAVAAVELRKVLGVGAVGLTQLLIWIATSSVLMKYRGSLLSYFGASATPMQFPTITASMIAVLVLFFLLGYTFYAALFAAIGSIVSSEQEAQQDPVESGALEDGGSGQAGVSADEPVESGALQDEQTGKGYGEDEGERSEAL